MQVLKLLASKQEAKMYVNTTNASQKQHTCTNNNSFRKAKKSPR